MAGAAPLTTALTETPAHLAVCPAGEQVDTFTAQCVPALVPNSPSCPPGVHGSICEGSVQSPSGPIGGVNRPQMPVLPPESGPAQQLEEVSTPDD
ncbi:hypothetical protein [Mycolicibacterium thermoresistibile]